MPTQKNADEVKQLIDLKKQQSRKKEIIFGDKIKELKKGEALLVKDTEWSLKTPIPSYYYSKYNKDKAAGKGKISVSCHKVDNGYLIVRN